MSSTAFLDRAWLPFPRDNEDENGAGIKLLSNGDLCEEEVEVEVEEEEEEASTAAAAAAAVAVSAVVKKMEDGEWRMKEEDKRDDPGAIYLGDTTGFSVTS
ncbi:hypothetical protein HZH66_001407 [Vespula vulgaris]|uniref:Uncharacterized protein n=1 Tax=Vespula vulgaris TaxID=7454 RepID=A0A834KV07_VESVU|nr:hypothetical protein HZH66_001407 [Vespula vulgaris]